MNKIIVLCGFSACGKDSLTKYISSKYGYKTIISTTTRPMREGESEGDPYYFITKDKFEEMIDNNEFIEVRKYNTLVNNIPDTWYYGVQKSEVDLTQNSYIVVLDIPGLIDFKKHFKDNIISFFINVDEQTRRARCIDRKDYDETEWNRRYLDDLQRFSPEIIEAQVDYIVENYQFAKCVRDIMRMVNE